MLKGGQGDDVLHGGSAETMYYAAEPEMMCLRVIRGRQVDRRKGDDVLKGGSGDDVLKGGQEMMFFTADLEKMSTRRIRR